MAATGDLLHRPFDLSAGSIDRFIGRGNPLAAAGGAQTLLRATGGNLYGAAFLAALARKESSFGAQAFAPNNFWGYGIHLGPDVNTAPTVEAMAAKVWRGLSGSLYRGAGLRTPSAIIARYAPPSENDTGLYQSQVNDWFAQMGLSPSTDIFSGSGGRSAAGVPRQTREAAGAPPMPGGQLTPEALRMVREYADRTRQQVLAGRAPEPSQGLISRLSFSGGGPAATPAAPRGTGGAQPYSPVRFTAGGGPEAHHSRALGNWQSDDAYDLMGKAGNPVYALVNGTVTKISGQPGGDPGFAGFGITVRTPNGDLFFKHLGSKRVAVGDRITPRTLIGTLDPSTAGGPHLHLGGTNRGQLDALYRAMTGAR